MMKIFGLALVAGFALGLYTVLQRRRVQVR
jgi:hypothetical protein